MPISTASINRRAFLKTASMAAAAMVSPKIHLGNLAGLQLSRPLCIGLLLPSSNTYPEMGNSLKAGLELGFQSLLADPDQVKMILAQVRQGYNRAGEKAQQLLEAGADLVVAAVNSEVADRLQDLFQSRQRVLLAATIGEHATVPGKPNPYIFYNSLNYWQANWALGAWTAQNLGQRVIAVSSFYESGYDGLYAFQRGVESAGGHVLDTLVTHLPADQGSLDNTLHAIQQQKPNVVYAGYCGQAGIEFLHAYRRAGLAGRLPLVGSSFLAEEFISADLGQATFGVKTCQSWAVNLADPANQEFQNAYQKYTGKAADIFAALGFDTAGLLVEALNLARGQVDPAKSLIQALEQASFEGPRGPLIMNAHTHTTDCRLYLREARRIDGHPANAVLGVLIGPDSPLKYGVKTGWLNSYLCAA
jgi:branched-chain amino acid transport system substrate-binding protein